jgi:hypothetical protein
MFFEGANQRMDMIDPHCLELNQDVLARSVVDRLRYQTHGRIRALQVACDGEVITIRGVVPSYYIWQLGFAAARYSARKAGGLLFDYQVSVSR